MNIFTNIIFPLLILLILGTSVAYVTVNLSHSIINDRREYKLRQQSKVRFVTEDTIEVKVEHIYDIERIVLTTQDGFICRIFREEKMK